MGFRDKLETVATGILTVCALIVTSIVVHRALAKPPDPNKPQVVEDWKRYAVGDMRIGSPNATVTITEFSDFQCPFCRKLYRSIEARRAKVEIVHRNFPLERLHPYARRAAIAAQCAAEQGHFADAYDLFFQKQDSLAGLPWNDLATFLGTPDKAAFNRCMNGTHVLATLKADSLAGSTLGIGGTPMVLVNRWLFGGAPPDSVLLKYIDKEFKAAKAN